MPIRKTTRILMALAATSLLQLLPVAYAQTVQHDMSSHSGDMKKSMDEMSRQMAAMPMTGDADRTLRR